MYSGSTRQPIVLREMGAHSSLFSTIGWLTRACLFWAACYHTINDVRRSSTASSATSCSFFLISSVESTSWYLKVKDALTFELFIGSSLGKREEIMYSRESYTGWSLTVKPAQDSPTSFRITSRVFPTSGGFFFHIFFAFFPRGFMSLVNLPQCTCISSQPRISNRAYCCICSFAVSTSSRVVVPAWFRWLTFCPKSTNVWFTLFNFSILSLLGWNLLKFMMQRGAGRWWLKTHSGLVFYTQP